MMGKKVIKVERTKNFIVKDYKDPPKKDVKGYRTKKLPSGVLVTVAILRKTGPRGGRTEVVNIKKPRRRSHAGE
jgi:hypothetical protein